MADKTIQELPELDALSGSDLLVVAKAGDGYNAKKMQGQKLVDYVEGIAQGVLDPYVERAETAADAAESASSGVAAYVDQAQQSASSAAESATAAEDAKNAAESAKYAIENLEVSSETLGTGQDATVEKSIVEGIVHFLFGLPRGERGEQGEKGSSIDKVERTSGNGAPGTTDTYTITTSDQQQYTFTVYNGADGLGSGDMRASVYDPDGNQKPIPYRLSELTEDAQHMSVTDSEKEEWSGKSDFSGNYSDLQGTPTIPTQLSQLSGDSTHRVVTDDEKNTWNAKSDFSGSYDDLSDKPNIPTVVDSVSSSSTTTAASSASVKAAYNLAYNAMPKRGGTFTGQVNGSADFQNNAYLFRNSVILSAESTPSSNGAICWVYE